MTNPTEDLQTETPFPELAAPVVDSDPIEGGQHLEAPAPVKPGAPGVPSPAEVLRLVDESKAVVKSERRPQPASQRQAAQKIDPSSKPDASIILTYGEWAELTDTVFGGEDNSTLACIRDWARFHLLGPIGVLVTILTRVSAACDPTVKLELEKGFPASTGLFTVLLGRPGDGKSKTISSTDKVVTLLSSDGTPCDYVQSGLGSGEGVLEAVAEVSGADLPRQQGVLLVDTEAGNVKKLLHRDGSTLKPNLSKLFACEHVGNSIRGERLNLLVGSYNVGVLIAAQPDTANAIIDGAGDGFTERFLWCEMLDPVRREGHDYSELEDTRIPPITIPDNVTLFFPDCLASEVLKERERVLLGYATGQNNHSRLIQMKAAGALAIIRGHDSVSMDDWRRAGALVAYSERLKKGLQDSAEQSRNEVADRKYLNRRADIATRFIERIGAASELVSMADLINSCRSDERYSIGIPAIELLISESVVCVEHGAFDSKREQRGLYRGPSWDLRHEVIERSKKVAG